MQCSEWFLTAVDGRELFCRFWSSGRPRALLLIFHGIGEHGGRYRLLAEALVPRGFAVMAPDQRGCGRSRDGGGAVSRYAELPRDLPRIVAEARRLAGNAPLILVGHSLGALTILTALAVFHPAELRGVIFSSPALRNRIPWPRILGVRILGALLPRVRLTFDADPSRLSHDPLMVEAHRRDSLINHRFTAGFLRDILRAMSDVRREVRPLPSPALFLYAGNDLLVDPAATRIFVEKLKSTGDAEAVCYEGAYHEVFNEVNREEVFARMAAWLDRILASPQASPEDAHAEEEAEGVEEEEDADQLG